MLKSITAQPALSTVAVPVDPRALFSFSLSPLLLPRTNNATAVLGSVLVLATFLGFLPLDGLDEGGYMDESRIAGIYHLCTMDNSRTALFLCTMYWMATLPLHPSISVSQSLIRNSAALQPIRLF